MRFIHVFVLVVVLVGCSRPGDVEFPGEPPTGDAGTGSSSHVDQGPVHDAQNQTDDGVEADAAPTPVDAGSDAGGDAEPTADAGPVPEPPPNLTALFTNPVDADTNDLVLEQAITDLLEATPAGASVRTANFTWTRQPMARAFVAAHERGVDVRVVVGNTNFDAEGQLNGAVTILRDALGDRLTICDENQSSGACIGTGINHNKFAIFSQLDDGSTKVVWQSSANFTTVQLRSFNNAVIVRNDPELYDAYLSYWRDLQADQTDLDYYHSVNGTLATKVYFFPRSSGDTIVGVLDNVHCDQGARVRLAMAFFTDPRIAIAQRLRSMADDGCDVAVTLRDGDLLDAGIVDVLTHPGVDMVIYPADAEPNVHSKYLLIDGAYGANATPQRLVWTGSHNYTGTALRRNDEVLLKIRDDAIFAAFERDWTNIRNRAP